MTLGRFPFRLSWRPTKHTRTWFVQKSNMFQHRISSFVVRKSSFPAEDHHFASIFTGAGRSQAQVLHPETTPAQGSVNNLHFKFTLHHFKFKLHRFEQRFIILNEQSTGFQRSSGSQALKSRNQGCSLHRNQVVVGITCVRTAMRSHLVAPKSLFFKGRIFILR